MQREKFVLLIPRQGDRDALLGFLNLLEIAFIYLFFGQIIGFGYVFTYIGQHSGGTVV